MRKIIELYNQIQKIPYFCLKERDPKSLIRKNKGSCSEKHLFLGKAFERMGISVKYLLIKFNWNDLPIPKEIIQKKDSPIGYHLALKIEVNKKRIIVDATWDPKLEKAGFPVTKNWQAAKDTKLAIKPVEILELDKSPPLQMKRLENRDFYKTLNRWLKGQRHKEV